MKRFVLYSVWFGALGGFLADALILVSWLIYPDGRSFRINTIWLFMSQILIAIPICMTRGVVERSLRLQRIGILIGVIAGVLTSGIILVAISRGLYQRHVFISAIIFGLSAGVVSRFNAHSSDLTRSYLSYLLIGLVGGILGFVTHYTITLVTSLLAMALAKVSFDVAILFDKFATPPIAGAVQSATIWYCIILIETSLLPHPPRQPLNEAS